MQNKLVVPNDQASTHRGQPLPFPLTSKPEIKPLTCNTSAEPKTAPCTVHGYHGFPFSDISGHPHTGHNSPVNKEAISLPSSTGCSPQTPREGLGMEEDTRSLSTQRTTSPVLSETKVVD